MRYVRERREERREEQRNEKQIKERKIFPDCVRQRKKLHIAQFVNFVQIKPEKVRGQWAVYYTSPQSFIKKKRFLICWLNNFG